MTGVTTAFSLGKSHRLWIGQTANPANDTTYTQLVNENDLTLTYKAENDTVNTKSGGKITIPGGDESFTLKGTADAVFTDAAFTLLLGAKNTAWAYQIRDMSGTNPTVIFEGQMVLTDMEFKMSEKGARQTTFTCENAGVMTLSLANPRALQTS